MAEKYLLKPDTSFIKRVKAAGGGDLTKCYQCATCSAVCQLSPEDSPFPRKEMLYAGWGLKDKLMADPDIWLCYQCNDCSVRCPRDAKPGDVIAAIRNYAFEHFAIPSFMGKLVAKPSGLIPLLLIPIIIMTVLMFATTGGEFASLFDGTHDSVDFKYFLKHDYVDITFVFGNILVFALFAISLTRFWKGLNSPYDSGTKVGFIPALISTVIEVLLHRRFRICDAAGYRNLAHMLLLFGFLAAFISTLWAAFNMLLLTKVLHLEGFYPPYSLLHPLKILGNLGGIAIIVGLVMVLFQRAKDPQSTGITTYSMSLFIWMLGIVGISGMMSQFFRMLGMPMVAYPSYFIHMTTVFFLLWYAPYSQFGHMAYRMIAMIYAESIGRKPKTLKASE
ncbi:MAG: quinone-interacting membrane-bound oxidoreductase complex subunit QmoC [Candidatus Electryoneaceae bacterium]|nr:quinone-interacting membrane-bound oxidoreductase complex subunit QmoC [Candidatus Electryoneaceae bacterium]